MGWLHVSIFSTEFFEDQVALFDLCKRVGTIEPSTWDGVRDIGGYSFVSIGSFWGFREVRCNSGRQKY
jgi:hypothetical protein